LTTTVTLTAAEIAARARAVGDAVLAPQADTVDAESRFPGEGLRALHDAGLMAIFLRPEMGGHDASVSTYVELAGILAERCASTAMVWAMHGQQLAVLLAHGAQSHREQLELVGATGCVIGSVTTDARGGADLHSTGPALVPDGGKLRLRRDAPVVTAGGCAGMYLVTMRADPSSPPTDTRLVCVLPEDGVVRECGGWDALGMRGTRSCPMQFDVLVEPQRVLRAPFAQIARDTMVPVGHLGWAGCWLGVARGAAERVRASLRGGRGSRTEALFARLAEAQLSIDLLESIVLRAASEVDRARRDGDMTTVDPVLINNVKLAGSRLALAAVNELIDAVGMRHGYLRAGGLALERALRDLRSAPLMFHDDRLLQANGRVVLAGARGLVGLDFAGPVTGRHNGGRA
jgi:acyl-CoA dehydrogenase